MTSESEDSKSSKDKKNDDASENEAPNAVNEADEDQSEGESPLPNLAGVINLGWLKDGEQDEEADTREESELPRHSEKIEEETSDDSTPGETVGKSPEESAPQADASVHEQPEPDEIEHQDAQPEPAEAPSVTTGFRGLPLTAILEQNDKSSTKVTEPQNDEHGVEEDVPPKDIDPVDADDDDAYSEDLDDGGREGAEQKFQSLDEEAERIERERRKHPGIPIILLFGLSGSGKSTLAYRLQNQAYEEGLSIDQEVWADDNNEQLEFASGTVRVRAHYFKGSGAGKDADAVLGEQFFLVDFPGELWELAVQKGGVTRTDPRVLKLLAQANGYIFALEAPKIISIPGRASSISSEYRSLFKSLARITDIDARLSYALSQTDDVDAAVAEVAPNLNQESGTNIKTPKPIFVALTKADVTCEAFLSAFIEKCKSRNVDLPQQLWIDWVDYIETKRRGEYKVEVGPSALLVSYEKEIEEILADEKLGSAFSTSAAQTISALKYPTYGVLENAPVLFAQLCKNVENLSFDFVSPFDGLPVPEPEPADNNDQSNENTGGKSDEKEKPKAPIPDEGLSHFGVKGNVTRLRNAARKHASSGRMQSILRRLLRPDQSISPIGLWISSSEDPKAMERSRDRANPEFGANWKRRILALSIGLKNGLTPLGLRNRLWRPALASILPLVLLVAIAIGVNVIGANSHSGLVRIENRTLSLSEVVPNNLLAEFSSKPELGWLAPNRTLRPWRQIPETGISRLVDPSTPRERAECNRGRILCRTGEQGALSFLDDLERAGGAIGYQAGFSQFEPSATVKSLRDQINAPGNDTKNGIGNTETFRPYHLGLLNLWLEERSTAKSNFESVKGSIDDLTQYPFGKISIDGSLSKEEQARLLLGQLTTIISTNEFNDAQAETARNITRTMGLHAATLNALGLIALEENDASSAKDFFANAAFLTSYASDPDMVFLTDQVPWIESIQTNALVTVNHSEVRTNWILANLLSAHAAMDRSNDNVSPDLMNQALEAFEALIRSTPDARRDDAYVAAFVNSQILRAMGAETSNDTSKDGELHVAPLLESTFFARGEIGRDAAHKLAVARLVMGENDIGRGASGLAERMDESLTALKVEFAQSVKAKFNASRANLGASLFSGFEANTLDDLSSEERREFSTFQKTLKSKVGKLIVDEAIETYPTTIGDSEETYLKRVRTEATWLNWRQKVLLMTYPLFGMSFPLLFVFTAIILLTSIWLFYFLWRLMARYDDKIVSKHWSDAKA
ncbi:MAG: hypothetical protein AAF996_03200 [Pseudomonadota bacterium]